MDCSLPGSSAHGIFQARILEWGPLPSPGRGHRGALRPWQQLCTHSLGKCSCPQLTYASAVMGRLPSVGAATPWTSPVRVATCQGLAVSSSIRCISSTLSLTLCPLSFLSPHEWQMAHHSGCVCVCVCVYVWVGGRSIFLRNECRATVRVLEPLCGPSFSQNHRWYMKSQGRDSGLCLKVVRCHRKLLSQKLCPDSGRLHTMFHLFNKLFLLHQSSFGLINSYSFFRWNIISSKSFPYPIPIKLGTPIICC